MDESGLSSDMAPDTTVSAREKFGIEHDFEVPAFKRRTDYVPAFDDDYRFDSDTTLAILAGFAHDQSREPQPWRLLVLAVDPVVADVRLGQQHRLAAIGGIAEDLLVARHRGVEHEFPDPVGRSSESSAYEDRSILQHESCWGTLPLCGAVILGRRCHVLVGLWSAGLGRQWVGLEVDERSEIACPETVVNVDHGNARGA